MSACAQHARHFAERCVPIRYVAQAEGDRNAIERAVLATFSFKPADIIKQLDLLHPIYSKTTNYGHFGKIEDPDLTWEWTNKADELRSAAR